MANKLRFKYCVGFVKQGNQDLCSYFFLAAILFCYSPDFLYGSSSSTLIGPCAQLSSLFNNDDKNEIPISLRSSIEESIVAALSHTRRMLELRRNRLQERLMNPIPQRFLGDRPSPEEWQITGVPSEVHQIVERRTFRIYVRTLEEYQSILQDRVLLSAYVPYRQVAPGVWYKSFEDLTGIFLTNPSAQASSVGLSGNERARYYIDLQLDSRIPVLQIENDIFLIPLLPRTRQWLIERGDLKNPEYQIPFQLYGNGPVD